MRRFRLRASAIRDAVEFCTRFGYLHDACRTSCGGTGTQPVTLTIGEEMRVPLQRKIALALFVTGIFMASPVVADKPDWAGHGKPDKGAKDSRDGDRGADGHDGHRDGRGE